ncbi:MAG: UDP-N-acetylmuramoyl-L-alanine--D-glutamate ligase [Bacteroidota bacterium]|nr:UDP-N-acetylmuramoyl-L-alanine--D-glutamate ligase [Bacteroidota bacterium]
MSLSNCNCRERDDESILTIKQRIFRIIQNKNVLILGYGREGKESYKLLRSLFPQMQLTIADGNENLEDELNGLNDKKLKYILGKDYLLSINNYDFIIKSPGISLKNSKIDNRVIISSQTDIFLNLFADKIIGVTGTKGKSTTVSLIYHILKLAGKDVILAGNIGIPVFGIIERIKKNTIIICELSAHQLEYISCAPHISVLLNLYEEHLDHYKSYSDYKKSKYNIFKFQTESDYSIYNRDDEDIMDLIKEQRFIRNYFPYSSNEELNHGSFIKDNIIHGLKNGLSEYSYNILNNERNLQGGHNLLNIMAAINVSIILDIDKEIITKGINSFKGLEHRIEYAGTFDGVIYYNDSISTIPEATIQAVITLKYVNTLLLGGFDRGINYNKLVDFILDSSIENIIFISDAGSRIYKLISDKCKEICTQNYFLTNSFKEAVILAKKHTRKGTICLLSPAAASYGMFRNFEERGKKFKELVAQTLK